MMTSVKVSSKNERGKKAHGRGQLKSINQLIDALKYRDHRLAVDTEQPALSA